MLRLPLDMEWWYDKAPGWTPELDGKFRCASWIRDGKLYGTSSLRTFTEMMEALPASVCFIGHNVLGADLNKCVELGIRLPADVQAEDSLLLARFFHPDWPDKDLKTVAREFGFNYANEAKTEDEAELLAYCGRDTYASVEIAAALVRRSSERLTELAMLQCRMAKAFFLAEIAGVYTDKSVLVLDQDMYERKLAELIPNIPEECATNDNVLRQWLKNRYTEKELQLLGKTASKDLALNVAAMKRLPRQNREFKAIVEARATWDYKTLYIDRPLELRDSAGFIFPRYVHLNARTQRRSTVPAIQNWPAGARHCMVSRFPGGSIVSADFRNLEARLFAYEARCWKFLDLLVEGGYPLIGEKAFGWHGVTKEDPRYKSLKIIVLAIQYNMGLGTYLRNLQVGSGITKTWQEADRDFAEFFEQFPEMYDERERRKQYARETGYTWSLIGARVPVPMFQVEKIWSAEEWDWRTKQRDNKAINYPTQGLASYVTGTSMLDIQDELTGSDFGAQVEKLVDSRKSPATWPEMYAASPGFPIIEVHDELVADTPPKKSEEMAEILRRHMTGLVTLKKFIPDFTCPIDVEVTTGRCWT